MTISYQTTNIYSLFFTKQIAIFVRRDPHIIFFTFSVPVLMATYVANLRRSPNLVWAICIDCPLNVALVRLSSWKLNDLAPEHAETGT